MNAHQWRTGVNITHHESNRSVDLRDWDVRDTFKAKDAEVAPASGEIRVGNLGYVVVSHVKSIRPRVE